MGIRDIVFVAICASWPILGYMLLWIASKLFDASKSLFGYWKWFFGIWARMLFPTMFKHEQRYNAYVWKRMKTGLFKDYFICRCLQYRLYMWNKKQFPK